MTLSRWLADQPQAVLEVDWSNPLTRGLIFLVPGNAAGGYRDIVGRKSATITGPRGTHVSRDGRFDSYASTTASYPAFGAALTSTTPSTVAWRQTAVGATGYHALAELTPNGAADTTLFYQSVTDAAYYFVVGLRGGVTAIDFTAVGALTNNKQSRFSLVASAGLSNTTAANWALFDGSTKLTGAGLAPLSAGSGVSMQLGARDAGSDPWAGSIGMFAIWSRALTDAEARSYNENPWQVLRLRRRVVAKAGGAGPISVSLTGNAATGAVGALGVAVSRLLSGNAATAAVGALGAVASTALTGNVATGALGAFGLSVTKALSGNAASGGVGTLTPSSAGLIELTGNAATGSIGTLGATVITALSGNAAACAVGSIAANAATALLGNASTGAAGSLAASVVVALSGNAATGATGTLTPQIGGIQIALSGVSATGALGAFGLAATTALSGNAANASAGSVTAAALRALSGNGAAGAVGSFQAFMQVVLSGVSATSALGNLLPPNTVQIALAGVSATGGTGELGLMPTADGSTRLGRRTERDSAERIGPEIATVLAYRIGS